MLKTKKGQNILEYTVIISVVAAALLTMSLYIRRAVQANLIMVQDQVNFEANR
jgi:Flp pilus assembly pilin Flp